MFMSVIQSTLQELRYMKRKNLEEESKVVGNYYRDLIRSFGIDCKYYKQDLKEFSNFNKIVDLNTILRRAYGYNSLPDYSMTANMIVYPEMQTDIFLLLKFGLNPQAEVDFYFDSTDFACALAPQCGLLKEYKIDETEIRCEVPTDPEAYPFELELKGKQHVYHCNMLSGDFRAVIPQYESDDLTHLIICDPYEHTDFNIDFPVNDELYKSLTYKIANDDYLETLLILKYLIHEVVENGSKHAYLIGKLTGSILFYDITSIGKYLDKIHPMVGDIVEIDFPDDNNREKYEITDCYEKQLTNDGISPLLHKYIWKCKAVRYVNSYEDSLLKDNEAGARLEERHDYEDIVQEEVAKAVSKYDKLSSVDGVELSVTEDDAYGGYSGVTGSYDKEEPNPALQEKYDFIDDGTAVVIMQFASGSKLVTTGYELIFIDCDLNAYQVACHDNEYVGSRVLAESNLRWLKATDDTLVFINIEGVVTLLAVDHYARKSDVLICLNDLNSKTLDVEPNNLQDGGNFYRFKGSRTYMFATGQHLFCKLASSFDMYLLI